MTPSDPRDRLPLALERVLQQVERPARYVGGELHSVVKDHARVRVRAVLAFPDAYEIGMSHLGLRILYHVVNGREDMLLERVFAPWPDMERALRAHGLPLFSLETRTPLAAFDVLGFSLQYELSFTNILTMLDLAGIPFRSADRDESQPLIVAGGPVAFSPEPVADFFDAVLLGDGEESFPRFLEAYAELRARHAGGHGGGRESRRRILRELARLDGVYVPSLYETEPDPLSGLHVVKPPAADETAEGAGAEAGPPFPIRRAVLADLDRFPFPADTIVPHAEIVHDRVSVEIARGCTEGCRFCQAGVIYRPLRERSADSILRTVRDGLAETGYAEANLTSLSPADYSSLPLLVEKTMDGLEDDQVGLAVSSLRPYGLTEELARQISRVSRTGFTIAPDAGTQRLRDVLNKGISEEQILGAARNAFRQGWSLIKLYFIIGLPTETEEDLAAIATLAERIWEIGREELRSRAGQAGWRLSPRVHLSASSLVPKPHTAFQWTAMEPEETLRAKARAIAARLRHRQIRFKHHDVETSRLEALFSRGDRRLGRLLERAWRLGCRFDGWSEHLRYDLWRQAMAEEGLAFGEFLRELPLEARLPWDHIDTTVKKEFLLREWKRALAGALTPACEKPHDKRNHPFEEGDRLICYQCGAECDLPRILSERVENHRRLLALPAAAGQMRPAAPGTAAPRADAPGFRCRAAFGKTGSARFLSHLDLARSLARAFRRAELPLKTSQGFNPRPLLSFGPALAVGYEGLEEYFDFTLLRPLPSDELAARLNATLPGGIRILRAGAIPPTAPAIMAAVREARYRAEVPLAAEAAPRDGAAEWHAARVREFNLAATHPVSRTKQRRQVERDLKRFVGEVRMIAAGAAAAAATLDEPVVLLEIPVSFREGASVRPDEVLAAIYGSAPRGCRIVRESLTLADALPAAGCAHV